MLTEYGWLFGIGVCVIIGVAAIIGVQMLYVQTATNTTDWQTYVTMHPEYAAIQNDCNLCMEQIPASTCDLLGNGTNCKSVQEQCWTNCTATW